MSASVILAGCAEYVLQRGPQNSQDHGEIERRDEGETGDDKENPRIRKKGKSKRGITVIQIGHDAA